MKNYLTVENIIDFTQLKSEAEQYRKELVLSQALVNSLKSEIEILNKEKKENNYNPENNQLNNNINSLNNNSDHILKTHINELFKKRRNMITIIIGMKTII